jgi:hypothetical protein
LASGSFNEFNYPLKDINGDSIPELSMLFWLGGHGDERRFLSVAPDSLFFLKNGDGYDGFQFIPGDLELIDLENDGIMEVYIHEFDIYYNKDYCRLYKWDGSKYILVNNDCREEK